MTTSARSRNEEIKEASRFLRGSIASGLEQTATGAIAEDDTQLVKFHGMYQQDDRDLRPERLRKKVEKAYSFMVRLRIPGGEMTPAQWLAASRVARERGNATLRLTTRQTIQFHGLLKGNLRPALRTLHADLLDSIAACGDVNRNVIATTNPAQSASRAAGVELARRLSDHLLPRSRAWHEIWIDGEQVTGGEAEDEPILGGTYLPRKFKIAIAVPPVNDVDVFAHDLGFIAIEENGVPVGYDVVIGGGMGMTHGEPDTFPRVGDVIGFCSPQEAVALAEHVVTIQRDWGDRADRRHARLKYTIERVGLARFVEELAVRHGRRLAPARPYSFVSNGDRLGWVEGEDGLWHYGLFVENGRIADHPGAPWLTTLETIAHRHRGAFLLTANQNLVIAGVPAGEREDIDAILDAAGLTRPGALRRNAMACVALPTCGLALAESERFLPTLVTDLERLLTRHGLDGQAMTIRMTGCPNGCARPYLAEIGLVGRGPGLYNLYLGGAFDGSRLNRLVGTDLDREAILAALDPLFAAYARERRDEERFSDFLIRTDRVAPLPEGPEAARP
ncbi:MAG: NADPH-dependent assimilatory sulfite reductase hemoprotein subunit [Rhodospirillales bacterium]|nr:NADPH-dependent assimilatory sulfite reductase hemoprotein subunit [Rhodospirillales bacterium]